MISLLAVLRRAGEADCFWRANGPWDQSKQESIALQKWLAHILIKVIGWGGGEVAGGFGVAKKDGGGKNAKAPTYLKISPPKVPELMTNVVSLFVLGIPKQHYSDCGVPHDVLEADGAAETVRERLNLFVRDRLTALATFEYASWINGRTPFVTPRELQLWRLLQFVKYIWFWDLPENDILATIFNATRRRAANLASDFEARFRKTILYPVALRRLYELLATEPLQERVDHPRRAWKGSTYRVESERYFEYLRTLFSDFRLFTEKTLIDPAWIDRDERIVWVPLEARDIAADANLRERLFAMYRQPSDDIGG